MTYQMAFYDPYLYGFVVALIVAVKGLPYGRADRMNSNITAVVLCIVGCFTFRGGCMAMRGFNYIAATDDTFVGMRNLDRKLIDEGVLTLASAMFLLLAIVFVLTIIADKMSERE